MQSVGWLHFTDLHFGLGPQRWMWPQVEDEFRRDLELLHRRSGPWDLVFFTGDLTQRGAPEEFASLDATLDGLWAMFRALGSDPVLVAVPGNHDLRRPPEVTPALRALRHWHDDEDLREELWAGGAGPYRAVIDEAFAAYEAWHARWRARHPLPREVEEVRGLLPGDRLVSFARRGLRLGLAGMNSAFLQLSAADYMGRLDLDVRQILDAADGSVGAWTRRHHLSLLLTHHPPEWLHARAQAHYRSHVTPQDRFAVHLFGHMHEPGAASMKIGGAPARRSIQGASLFGLENWGADEAERIHGYSAGRFEVQGELARLRVWPRIMRAHKDAGHWRLVPDFDHFDLDPETLCWTDASIPVHSRPPEPVDAPTTPPPDVRGLRPPGAPYHADWYVARPLQELQALTALRSPGVPAVVLGSDLSGTSFFVRHVSRTYAAEVAAAGGRVRVVDVDLGNWGEEAADDADALFRSIAEVLIEADGRAAKAWQRSGSLEYRLTNAMRRVLGDDDAEGQVLLVVERAHAVVGRAAEEPFFRMLRSWAESAYKAPWPRLRMLVALSTAPLFLRDTVVTSPFFNRVASIHLRDFDLEQTRSLARLMNVGWPDADLTRLMGQVGGHPYLLHTALFHAALGEPADLLLDAVHLEDDVFRQHLGQRWLWVQRDAKLVDAIRAVLRGDAAVDPRDFERLRMAGLVHRDGARVRMRNTLYDRYFRQLLSVSA